VAAKMGIADSVVRSWEYGSSQPDSKQLTFLLNLFGADPKKEANIAALLFLSEPGMPFIHLEEYAERRPLPGGKSPNP